jgi:hypothetical protein
LGTFFVTPLQEIKNAIRACSNMHDIRELLVQHGPALSPGNTAAVLVKLATMKYVTAPGAASEQPSGTSGGLQPTAKLQHWLAVKQLVNETFDQMLLPLLEMCSPRHLADVLMARSETFGAIAVNVGITEAGFEKAVQQFSQVLDAFVAGLSKAGSEDVSRVLLALTIMQQQQQRHAQLEQMITHQQVHTEDPEVTIAAVQDGTMTAPGADQAEIMEQPTVSTATGDTQQTQGQAKQQGKHQVHTSQQPLPASMNLQQMYMLHIEKLMDTFLVLLRTVKLKDLSTALLAVITLQHPLPAGQLQVLLINLAARSDSCPEAISGGLWAAAQWHKQQQQLLRQEGVAGSPQQVLHYEVQLLLAALVKMQPTAAEAVSIAEALWATATLGCSIQAADLQQLLNRVLNKLQDCPPRALGEVLWAVGKLAMKVSTVGQLMQLIAALQEQASVATAVDLTIGLWGAVKAGYQVPAPQLQVLLAALAEKQQQLKPWMVAQVLRAVAELPAGRSISHADGSPLRLLVAAFVQQVHTARPSEISAVLCTIAMAAGDQYLPADHSVELLFTSFMGKIGDAEAQALAEVIVAMCKLQEQQGWEDRGRENDNNNKRTTLGQDDRGQQSLNTSYQENLQQLVAAFAQAAATASAHQLSMSLTALSTAAVPVTDWQLEQMLRALAACQLPAAESGIIMDAICAADKLAQQQQLCIPAAEPAVGIHVLQLFCSLAEKAQHVSARDICSVLHSLDHLGLCAPRPQLQQLLTALMDKVATQESHPQALVEATQALLRSGHWERLPLGQLQQLVAKVAESQIAGALEVGTLILLLQDVGKHQLQLPASGLLALLGALVLKLLSIPDVETITLLNTFTVMAVLERGEWPQWVSLLGAIAEQLTQRASAGDVCKGLVAICAKSLQLPAGQLHQLLETVLAGASQVEIGVLADTVWVVHQLLQQREQHDWHPPPHLQQQGSQSAIRAQLLRLVAVVTERAQEAEPSRLCMVLSTIAASGLQTSMSLLLQLLQALLIRLPESSAQDSVDAILAVASAWQRQHLQPMQASELPAPVKEALQQLLACLHGKSYAGVSGADLAAVLSASVALGVLLPSPQLQQLLQAFTTETSQIPQEALAAVSSAAIAQLQWQQEVEHAPVAAAAEEPVQQLMEALVELAHEASPEHLLKVFIALSADGVTVLFPGQQVQQLLSAFLQKLLGSDGPSVTPAVVAVAAAVGKSLQERQQKLPGGLPGLAAEQLQQLKAAVVQQSQALSPADLSLALVGVEALCVPLLPGDLEHLLNALLAKLAEVSTHDISQVLLTVPKLGPKEQGIPLVHSAEVQGRLRRLIGVLTRRSWQASPEDVCAAVTAISRLDIQVSAYDLQLLLGSLVAKLETLPMQDIAGAITAVARISKEQLPVAAKEQVQLLLKALEQGLEQGELQRKQGSTQSDGVHISLLHALSSVAQLQLPFTKRRFQLLVKHLAVSLDGSSPSLVAEALATIGSAGRQLGMESIAKGQLLLLLGGFCEGAAETELHSLLMALSAVANFHIPFSAEQMQQVVDALTPKLVKAAPLQFSTALAALAELVQQQQHEIGLEAKEALQQLLGLFLELPAEVKGPSICRALAAAGVLGLQATIEQLQQLLAALLPDLQARDSGELANALHGTATIIGNCCPGMAWPLQEQLQLFACMLARKASSSTPKDLCTALSALDGLQVPMPSAHLSQLAAALSTKQLDMTGEQLATAVSAFATLSAQGQHLSAEVILQLQQLVEALAGVAEGASGASLCAALKATVAMRLEPTLAQAEVLLQALLPKINDTEPHLLTDAVIAASQILPLHQHLPPVLCEQLQQLVEHLAAHADSISVEELMKLVRVATAAAACSAAATVQPWAIALQQLLCGLIAKAMDAEAQSLLATFCAVAEWVQEQVDLDEGAPAAITHQLGQLLELLAEEAHSLSTDSLRALFSAMEGLKLVILASKLQLLLRAVLDQHEEELTGGDVCKVIAVVGSMGQEVEVGQLKQLLELLSPNNKALGFRERATSLFAVSSVRLTGGPWKAVHKQLVCILYTLITEGVGGGAAPEDVCMLLSAAAELEVHMQVPQLQQLLGAFLEATHPVTAATCQDTPLAATLVAAAKLCKQQPELASAVAITEQLQQLASILAEGSQSSPAGPAEVCAVLSAAASLQLKLPALQLQRLLSQFIKRLEDGEAADVAGILVVAAQYRQAGGQVSRVQLRQVVTAMAALAGDAAPADVCKALSAINSMKLQPPADELQLLLNAFYSKMPMLRGRVQDALVGDAARTVMRLQGCLGKVPTEQRQQLVEALAASAAAMDVAELCMVFSSVANVGMVLLADHADQLLGALVAQLPAATVKEIGEAALCVSCLIRQQRWLAVSQASAMGSEQQQLLLVQLIGVVAEVSKRAGLKASVAALTLAADIEVQLSGKHLLQLVGGVSRRSEGGPHVLAELASAIADIHIRRSSVAGGAAQTARGGAAEELGAAETIAAGETGAEAAAAGLGHHAVAGGKEGVALTTAAAAGTTCAGPKTEQDSASVAEGDLQRMLVMEMHQVLIAFLQKLPQADCADVAVMLAALAKLGVPVSCRQLQDVQEGLAGLLHGATPSTLTKCMWAVVELQQCGLITVEGLHSRSAAETVVTEGADTTAATLAEQQAAFQKSRSVLQHLVYIFLHLLPQATFEDVASMLAAVATSQMPVSHLQLQQLQEALLAMLHEAKPHAVAQSLWAVAAMGFQLGSEQLHAMLAVLLGGLGPSSTTAEDISTALWALATMRVQAPEAQLQQLLATLSEPVLLAGARPLDLSVALWAATTLGRMASGQVQQLLDAFHAQLRQAPPQAISQVLWAAATMGKRLQHEELRQLLQAFSAQVLLAAPSDVSMALWGAASMGFMVESEHLLVLLGALAACAQPQHPHAPSFADVSTSLWSVAAMGYKQQRLLQLQPQLIPLMQQLLGYAVNWLSTDSIGSSEAAIARPGAISAVADALWSVASLGLIPLPEQLQVLSTAFANFIENQRNCHQQHVLQLQPVSGIDVSMVLYAWAALGHQLPWEELLHMLEVYCQAAVQQPPGDLRVQVPMLIWSCATILQQQQELLSKEELMKRLAQCADFVSTASCLPTNGSGNQLQQQFADLWTAAAAAVAGSLPGNEGKPQASLDFTEHLLRILVGEMAGA